MNIFTFADSFEADTPFFYNNNFRITPDSAICNEKCIENGKIKFKFYVPERIVISKVVPFVYIRISRPCKALSQKFAHRHYEVCGYGVHFFSDTVAEGDSLDNSIFLSPPIPIISSDTNCSDKDPYSGFECFDSAISRASQYITLRVGDYIAIESPSLDEFGPYKDKQVITYQDIEIELNMGE